jgi:hypothetical protein
MTTLKLICYSLLLSTSSSFVGNIGSQRVESSCSELAMAPTQNSRRALLTSIMAASPVLMLSQQAQAKDELFKGNPLTNSVLEQVL